MEPKVLASGCGGLQGHPSSVGFWLTKGARFDPPQGCLLLTKPAGSGPSSTHPQDRVYQRFTPQNTQSKAALSHRLLSCLQAPAGGGHDPLTPPAPYLRPRRGAARPVLAISAMFWRRRRGDARRTDGPPLRAPGARPRPPQVPGERRARQGAEPEVPPKVALPGSPGGWGHEESDPWPAACLSTLCGLYHPAKVAKRQVYHIFLA